MGEWYVEPEILCVKNALSSIHVRIKTNLFSNSTNLNI